MAHGTPDWGVTAGGVTVYQMNDLAEAVARLGSMVTFDRRGDIVWGDDFERSLNKWTTGATGTGASVALSTARARNGRYSVLLTGGSTGLGFAAIAHRQGFPVSSRMGVEFSFARTADFNRWDLPYSLYDGVNLAQFTLRYRLATPTLSLLDGDGVEQTIAADLTIRNATDQFNTVKLVVDVPNRRYQRVLFNNRAFDISAHSGQLSADATGPSLEVDIFLYPDAGQNDSMAVDDVILTQNEPA